LKGPESVAWVSTTGQKVTEIYAILMENHWKIMDEIDEITGYDRENVGSSMKQYLVNTKIVGKWRLIQPKYDIIY